MGGKFYGASHYASNYDDKGIAVRSKIANIPDNQVLPKGGFVDSTTYANHYIEAPLQKNIRYRHEDELKLNEGPFKGSTSYDSDYIAKQGQARQPTVSYPSNEVLPNGKFAGRSTY